MKRFVAVLMLMSGLFVAGGIFAAPYSITHTGTIGSSTIAGINSGEPYTVELVFDNGGSSANSQAWTGAHLTCAIFSMNTGGTAQFYQNLTLTPPSTVTGSVTTNGSGALTANFSNVTAIPAANYTTSGFTLTNPAGWSADNFNPIFLNNLFAETFNGNPGGVVMAFTSWTNPAPFNGSCSAPTPSAVPALSEWTQLMLGLMVMMLVGWHFHRERSV